MAGVYLDINCDVGEGVGNEADIFPFISSCNIACGGHAGNVKTMKHTVRLAKAHGVAIGAHPSYPDKQHFGRVRVPLSATALQTTIRTQIGQLGAICKDQGITMVHIKPHGALYNDVAHDMELAPVFLDAVSPYKAQCALYVLSGSPLEALALKEGFTIKREAFADRNYQTDGRLVPRGEKDALIQHPEAVLAHVLRMAKERRVLTVEGNYRPLQADTYCVHGDTPDALEILAYLTKELPNHNYRLKE
jgi:5-oxoprolinase (ATP-hydrolysing) subunit A